MGSSDKVNLDREVHELGNMTMNGADEARPDRDSKLSRRDFEDRDQLARLGKKAVLKVCVYNPPIASATILFHFRRLSSPT